VRLKRNPDSRPTAPSPSDQLIIAAPDSRLRHVTREEIPLK
jgi:hypothetical protein